ncbi:hypothetical protein K435DRAFT_868596 [Dendrothele bispora CBS 962.96]|uniref:Uncharacterized protein n=1 Tax=Dendrothele bispora (strain CBS 962.96) TaxID=1314807 RepID=A0A4S8LBA1_DENBC|nr:hypothetical protein K435DRAFT_868596 [Dendrothele bispora CBS 962.96]
MLTTKTNMDGKIGAGGNLGEYNINNSFTLALALRNGLVQPPYCLHLLNPLKESSWSVMELVTTENEATGRSQAYFTASTHKCVKIPIKFVEDEQLVNLSFLGTSGHAWQIDIEMQLRKEILDWDMLSRKGRYYRPVSTGGTGLTRTKKKRPSWWNIHESSRYISFYDKKVSEERKQSDEKTIYEILENAAQGVYLRDPIAHPAYNLLSRPGGFTSLKSFHGKTSISSTWSTGSGPFHTAIVLLNSRHGLSAEAFCSLRMSSIQCPSCHCFFSANGYQSHLLKGSFCLGTPELEEVPSILSLHGGRFSPTSLVQFMPASKPAGNILTFDNPAMSSPIAQAWLKWDSRGGVTREDWVTIATAWQNCPECSLLFSFDGYCSHQSEATLWLRFGFLFALNSI